MAAISTTSPALLSDLRELIGQARQGVAQSVNSALVLLYWEIGARIRSDILKSGRAAGGDEIFSTLSRQLSEEFGSDSSSHLFVVKREERGHPSLRRPDDVKAIGFATSLLMSGPIPFPSSASGPFSPCFSPPPAPAANPPSGKRHPQSSRRPRCHKGWMATCVHSFFTPGVDAFARSARVLTFPAGLRQPQSWVAQAFLLDFLVRP